MKLSPAIISVKVAPPTLAEFGLREVMIGTGLVAVLPEPAELAPPPQPAENSQKSKQAKARTARGARIVAGASIFQFSLFAEPICP